MGQRASAASLASQTKHQNSTRFGLLLKREDVDVSENKRQKSVFVPVTQARRNRKLSLHAAPARQRVGMGIPLFLNPWFHHVLQHATYGYRATRCLSSTFSAISQLSSLPSLFPCRVAVHELLLHAKNYDPCLRRLLRLQSAASSLSYVLAGDMGNRCDPSCFTSQTGCGYDKSASRIQVSDISRSKRRLFLHLRNILTL